MFHVEQTLERDGARYDIRSMNGRDEMELLNGLTADETIPVDRLYRLLNRCLTGWQDAKSLRGDDLGAFAPPKIDWLPALVVDWLAAEIMKLSQASDEEKKTSSDSPSSANIPVISSATGAPV